MDSILRSKFLTSLTKIEELQSLLTQQTQYRLPHSLSIVYTGLYSVKSQRNTFCLLEVQKVPGINLPICIATWLERTEEVYPKVTVISVLPLGTDLSKAKSYLLSSNCSLVEERL